MELRESTNTPVPADALIAAQVVVVEVVIRELRV